MALNFVNVVGRYVFSTAILGADEVQVFVMVWMTFAGAAVVTWRNQHLRMDVLFDLLPAKARRWIRLAEVTLLAVMAGFAAVQSVRFAALMVSVDRRSEAANIPMVIPHSAVVLGFALMALLALVKLARLARGAEEG
ncbi:MAG TPA: TRAP transporter small permease [Burkholderiales bacterium]|nr:TRAP transporter small permease [Burkholderiales bacterium]